MTLRKEAIVRLLGENRWWIVRVIALACLLAGANDRAPAQTKSAETVAQRAIRQFESSSLQVISLGKHIFMFSGDGGNVVAIASQADTLLIDSGVASRTGELSEAVYKATTRPITRLVNTHWHFDRTGGNTFFGSAGVTIIAQENVRRRLSSVQSVPFVGVRDGHYPAVALPTETYSASLTLNQGTEDLTLVNYGSAHTDGDTIIYLNPGSIVVMGDIFSNTFYPVIDLGSGGSIDGLIRSVEEVLKRTNEQTRIVPGHGRLASRADLQAYRDMLVEVRDRVQQLLASGHTMTEVVAARPTAAFDAKWGTGYMTGQVFTEMVYSSLVTKAAPQ